MSRRNTLVVGFLSEACYLAFYFFPSGPVQVLVLIGVGISAFLLQTVLVLRMRRMSPEKENRTLLLLVIGFGMLFRITLVPHSVVGSDDIYRYVWDGKVAAAGINPYQYLPTDPHLSFLAGADLPAKVNHPELRSIYPPLSQAFFLLSHSIFGDSVTGMKFLLVVLDFGTILLLLVLLRRMSRPSALMLYAWSPLPILYFGLDGHIDALGLPFLILFIILITGKKPWLAALALGLAGLAKLVPLIVAPLLLRLGRGFRHILVLATPILLLIAGYVLFYEPTGGMLDSMNTFGSRWEFNGGIFTVAYYLSGPDNATAHRVCAILIVCWIGFLALVRRPLIEKIFWCFVGFILFSPVVHPWYLTWLAALVALRWSTAVFTFLGLSGLANIVVYQYQFLGQWNDQPLLLLAEYVPVAVLLARELVRGDVLRKSDTGAQSLLLSSAHHQEPV